MKASVLDLRRLGGLVSLLILLFSVSSCEDKPVDPSKPVFKTTSVDPASIFDKRLGPIPILPADNPFTEEGISLGRMLFYDPILSIDSTISCGSCHKQEYAFADGPVALSRGVFGLVTHRNTPPIFNLAYNKKFFWDARQNTLRELVFEPIQAHNEMAMTLPMLDRRLRRSPMYKDAFLKAFNAEPNVFDMSLAMEQFLLSIVSYRSRFNEFFPGKFSKLTPEEGQGALLFNALVDFDLDGNVTGADCFHCHGDNKAQIQDPTFGGIANNGLDLVFTDKGYGGITGRAQDMGTFKTPSLLNIQVTGPYMHDGRFKTLDEVIDHYSEGVKFSSPNLNPMMSHEGKHLNLKPAQKAALKAFMLSMTDTAFLNDPRYSNPFKK